MLNQDFKEFIQLLNDNKVRYLVLGYYVKKQHYETLWKSLAKNNYI